MSLFRWDAGGFVGKSLFWVLGFLWMPSCGRHRRRATEDFVEAAEKASRRLWLRRGEAWHGAVDTIWTQVEGLITPGWVAWVRVYD